MVGPRTRAAGRRIDGWLSKSGQTQTWLADKIGASQPSVRAFLKGENGTSLENIAAMAEVFGRTLVDVFATKEPPPSKYADVVTAFNAMPTDSNRATVMSLMREFVDLPPQPAEDQPSAPRLRLARRSPAEKK